MKKKHLGFFLFIAFSMLIFQFSIAFKNNEKQSLNKSLLGIWVQTKYAAGSIELTRSKSFLNNNPGIEFKTNGKMVKRANSSWCGTPPISYRNYNGIWTVNPVDSTVHAIYDFWGGKFDNIYKVKSLSNSELVLEIVESKTIKE